MIEISSKMKRLIVAIIGLGLILWSAGIVDPDAIDVPIYWRLLATGLFLSAVIGWIAGEIIYKLLPEDRGTFLVAFSNDDDGGGEVWELKDDDWRELEVHGTLKEWPKSKDKVYECREYDPERNVAIANWRESKPGSALASHATPEDAMAAIRELRYDLEPDAAKSRELQRRIRGIIRKIDAERAAAQNEIIDDHATPSMGSRTISEIIDETLPAELHPSMTDPSKQKQPEKPNSEETISFDILDESEPITPQAAATDGGKDE